VRAAVSTGFGAVLAAIVVQQHQHAVRVRGQHAYAAERAHEQQSKSGDQGIRDPRPHRETSVNLSAGITARPRSNLSLTADFYRITIDNRIVITSQFSASDTVVARILAPFQGRV